MRANCPQALSKRLLSLSSVTRHILQFLVNFIDQLPRTTPPLIFTPENITQRLPLFPADGPVLLPFFIPFQLRMQLPGRGVMRGPKKTHSFIGPLSP